MPPSLLETLVRFSLSISAQVVILAVMASGLVLIIAQSEPVLVLALLASYLAASVLLAYLAAPELAFVVALIGVFVALVMQFTAAELRQGSHASDRHRHPSPAFRLLIALIAVWLLWSLGLLEQPLDALQISNVWLAASAGTALATSSDAFKTGIALLMVLASSLLYYATSSAEVSLLVLGIVAVSAFLIALASSHLALASSAEGGEPT